jgi:hypothetical protein
MMTHDVGTGAGVRVALVRSFYTEFEAQDTDLSPKFRLCASWSGMRSTECEIRCRGFRKKIGGAVQAVETIRLGVRMDILAARTSGDRYNT